MGLQPPLDFCDRDSETCRRIAIGSSFDFREKPEIFRLTSCDSGSSSACRLLHMLRYEHMAMNKRAAVPPTMPKLRVGIGRFDSSALGEECCFEFVESSAV